VGLHAVSGKSVEEDNPWSAAAHGGIGWLVYHAAEQLARAILELHLQFFWHQPDLLSYSTDALQALGTFVAAPRFSRLS
jgi:hypothetical protein